MKKGMNVIWFVFFLLLTLMFSNAFAGTTNLPQTGQTKCYALWSEISCAGTGQDGEILSGVAWPNPRFSVNGDCVTDNLTGLMWAKNANLPNGIMAWMSALNYVAQLNSSGGLCGYTDWVLPNITELESLVNANEPNLAAWLYTQGFTNVHSSRYWSSTSSSFERTDSWTVEMLYGGVWGYFKNYDGYVWPVRSEQVGFIQLPKTGQTKCYSIIDEISCAGTGQDGEILSGVAWPNPRFSVNGDCVTDNLTGLMWAKNANLPNVTRDWQGAIDYSNNLTLCSYSDWRLPNRKELMSLIDRSKSVALPYGHPFLNVGDKYWSSTTNVINYPNGAWYVNIFSGNLGGEDKAYGYYVWPVRGGIIDVDGDGFKSDIDCDDSNPIVNPGATEIPNNGIDDDCNPATPIVTVSGNAYNYPIPLFRASMSINVDASNLSAGYLRYYYTRNRTSLSSTSITGITATGGIATVTGVGTVNGTSGYTFTATITDGSPDTMGLEINKPDGTPYFSSSSQQVSSGIFIVVGQ